MTDFEDVKKNYLDFVSSELTSHSATLVGVALLFFSFIELFTRQDFLQKTSFPPVFTYSWDTARYASFFVVAVVLNTSLLYLLLRWVYYGALAHEIMTLKGFQCEKISELHAKIMEDTQNKRFLNWFRGGISLKSKGFMFCFLLGVLVSIFMMFALFVK